VPELFDPDDAERTSGGKQRSSQVLTTVPPEDPEARLKTLVAQVGSLKGYVSACDSSVSRLSTEVAQLRRDVELDRKSLVHDASKSAARKSSNRVAMLMSGALLIWEQVGPVVGPLVRGVLRAIAGAH
jgi:hypothetical protein